MHGPARSHSRRSPQASFHVHFQRAAAQNTKTMGRGPGPSTSHEPSRRPCGPWALALRPSKAWPHLLRAAQGAGPAGGSSAQSGRGRGARRISFTGRARRMRGCEHRNIRQPSDAPSRPVYMGPEPDRPVVPLPSLRPRVVGSGASSSRMWRVLRWRRSSSGLGITTRIDPVDRSTRRRRGG